MTLISIRTCRLLFGAAAGALLLSCEPEVSVTEWTPVAYSEILGEMDNLSGRLLSDDPSETAAFLDEQAAEAGGLEQTSTFLRDLYRQVEPIEKLTPWEFTFRLVGLMEIAAWTITLTSSTVPSQSLSIPSQYSVAPG